MRLYHHPRTRSTRVLWLLEEIGAPYDVTLLAWEEREGAEHLARHPLGRVPVIEEEGGFVFESAAICLHLADLHPDAGLLPPVGTHERALAYQWTLFAMTELEGALLGALALKDGDQEQYGQRLERFRTAALVIERALGEGEYLAGDRFGVADVVVGGVLAYGKRFELLDGMPRVAAYLERLEARPARQRALAVGAPTPAP